MEGIVPTMDLNGNNGGYGWGGAGGAFAGALVGSIFGNGWGGGWGGRGNGGCCGGNEMIMDSLSGLRSDVGGISRDQLLQSANNLAQQCTGFGTVNASVERVGAAAALAAARQEAATLTVGYQGQLAAKDNTFQIVSSQKDCCCQTQRLIEAEGCATRQAIHAEGEATRGLITQNEIQALRDRLATAEAGNAILTQQQFATTLAQQTQANIIAALRPATTTTTPAA
ncbi:MAG: hypothetical protein HDQ88_09005 [Clostridia bacterium]|nr:hypothetical protein [Clostridia bacterium]